MGADVADQTSRHTRLQITRHSAAPAVFGGHAAGRRAPYGLAAGGLRAVFMSVRFTVGSALVTVRSQSWIVGVFFVRQ
jgi:hypothetical protein